MFILDQIIAYKKTEVAERQSLYPVQLLERSRYFQSPVVSLKQYLQRPGESGIIAEFKRRSPSRGIINAWAGAAETSLAYMQAGASALSVLTDEKFFGGKNDDLLAARKYNFCPVLRKDFIISEYQVIEARSIGADAVLLIAEALTAKEIQQLSSLAVSLGMEVLLEMNNADQMDKIAEPVTLVGVNNRNLRDFSVDVSRSFSLAEQLKNNFTLVSESGIGDPSTIIELRQAGFSGFLMGETFMKNAEPGKACAQFISTLRRLEKEQLKSEIA